METQVATTAKANRCFKRSERYANSIQNPNAATQGGIEWSCVWIAEECRCQSVKKDKIARKRNNQALTAIPVGINDGGSKVCIACLEVTVNGIISRSRLMWNCLAATHTVTRNNLPKVHEASDDSLRCNKSSASTRERCLQSSYKKRQLTIFQHVNDILERYGDIVAGLSDVLG